MKVCDRCHQLKAQGQADPHWAQAFELHLMRHLQEDNLFEGIQLDIEEIRLLQNLAGFLKIDRDDLPKIIKELAWREIGRRTTNA